MGDAHSVFTLDAYRVQRIRHGLRLCRWTVDSKACTLRHGHRGICRSDWFGSGFRFRAYP